jgi:hypothetical protein
MDPTLRTLIPSFRRNLLATNRSVRTVQTYVCALDGLTRYLEAEGLPGEVRAVRAKQGVRLLRVDHTIVFGMAAQEGYVGTYPNDRGEGDSPATNDLPITMRLVEPPVPLALVLSA